MTDTTLFVQKLKEHESLIRYAAKRYRIQGVVEPEDLYQEGLMILHQMIDKYDFDPYSDDFRKMFKTELWHGLWKMLRHSKATKRDHRATVVHDFQEPDYDEHGNHEHSKPRLNAALASPDSQPDEAVSDQQHAARTVVFLHRLRASLDSEARDVLDYVLNPPTWDDVPPALRVTKEGDEYWKLPSRIPQHVTAFMLGIPIIRFRRALKRIRKKAALIGDEEGLDLVAAAGIRKFGSL